MSDTPPVIAGSQPVAPAALLHEAEKQRFRTLVGRVAVGLAVVASLALVWWSLRSLSIAQRQRADSERQLNEMTREVDAMAARWSPTETNRIAERVVAIDDTLVENESALRTWVGGIKKEVANVGFRSEVTFKEGATPKVGEVDSPLVPTTIHLTAVPNSEDASTAFQRLLRAQRHVLTRQERADLVELTVTGNSNSVAEAVAILNVWGRSPAAAKVPQGQ